MPEACDRTEREEQSKAGLILVDSGYLRPELLVGWYFGVSEQEAREKYMPEPRPMLRFPEE